MDAFILSLDKTEKYSNRGCIINGVDGRNFC